MTPMYLIFSKLGFLGNHLTAPVAIAASSIPFVIVTLRPYFRSIPVSLDEAARLDGCGSVKAFLMVMLPAVKTGIITIMVISFLNGWNDLVYSMTFNVAETMRPLTANIYKFQYKMELYHGLWCNTGTSGNSDVYFLTEIYCRRSCRRCGKRLIK